MRVFLVRAILSSFCLTLLSAQPVEDPQKIAQTLFPKAESLQHLRLNDIAKHLGLRAGSVLADVGCGTGEESLIFSRAVGPTGRIYAEDIDNKGALPATRKLVKKHKARNITVIHGTVDDPRLPTAALDGVWMLAVYHELNRHREMLAKIRAALKPDGRLVVIDPLPRKIGSRSRELQMKSHVLNPDIAEKDLREAGFEILHRDDHFVDHPDSEAIEWLIVAKLGAPAPSR